MIDKDKFIDFLNEWKHEIVLLFGIGNYRFYVFDKDEDTSVKNSSLDGAKMYIRNDPVYLEALIYVDFDCFNTYYGAMMSFFHELSHIHTHRFVQFIYDKIGECDMMNEVRAWDENYACSMKRMVDELIEPSFTKDLYSSICDLDDVKEVCEVEDTSGWD